MKILVNRPLRTRLGVFIVPGQLYSAVKQETPSRYLVDIGHGIHVTVLAAHVIKEYHDKFTHTDCCFYDNGGQTFDRYTVVYGFDKDFRNPGRVTMRGMSENPTHPQGFGQLCEGVDGSHLGKPISFHHLPDACKAVVSRDLADYNEGEIDEEIARDVKAAQCSEVEDD